MRLHLLLVLLAAVEFDLSAPVTVMAQEVQKTSPPDVIGPPLSETEPLTMQGDVASELVATADQFLLRRLAQSPQDRHGRWDAIRRTTTRDPQRQQLAKLLGVVDPRHPAAEPEAVSTLTHSSLLASSEKCDLIRIRWASFGDVTGEGLMLVPKQSILAQVIVIPHVDTTPEALIGWGDAQETEKTKSSRYIVRLAESGCRVIVPYVIPRSIRAGGITWREWLHRAAYEMGRTLTGYEVQKTLALVDWLDSSSELPIGVMGWGDGGLQAWYAGALDPRIDVVGVGGAFGGLDTLWQQPIDRMVFSLLHEFGDAELASLVAPRTLILETGNEPVETRTRAPGEGGGPYQLSKTNLSEVEAKIQRAREIASGAVAQPSDANATSRGNSKSNWLFAVTTDQVGDERTLTHFFKSLVPSGNLAADSVPRWSAPHVPAKIDGDQRLQRQVHEIDRHTQQLLRESVWVRNRLFWDKLDTSSLTAYEKSIAPFRESFYRDVIGRFDESLVAARPRTRLIAESPRWKRYEVVLNVFDDLFAYGILTVPQQIPPGERRAAVVCQHGLEGRPQSVIGEQDFHYYHAFATELAEEGFVTFAPQNLYIFEDRFRTLQRKANPLGKTLYSLIIPQHQQIVDWLQSLPFVDPDRVAFYGLSYGGKTAMRVPPVVTDYCLSICSADFNEWVDKNASTHNPRSYVDKGEYEIFEWNLGHTFNYAEMAALIAPRPFMVERGHGDGVADDWTVAWEYARVRLLYASKLKRPELTEIEWFDGPHTIHAAGTYAFLRKHLGKVTHRR